MTGMEVIGEIVSLAGTCFAIIFAYTAFIRNKKTDDRNDATKDGVVLTKLEYIKAGIDDIKTRQEEQEHQYIEVVTRLTSVEGSTKHAHQRIDELNSKKA